MNKLFFFFFSLLIWNCCKSQSLSDAFSCVNRTALPYNLYASTETSVAFVELTSLALCNNKKGIELTVLLSCSSKAECDSIKLIYNKKKELLLKQISSSFTKGTFRLLSEIKIYYLVDHRQTDCLKGNDILEVVLYFGKNNHHFPLTKKASEAVKGSLDSL